MSEIRIVEGRPAVLRETTGERLQRLRLARGWTREQLTLRAGIAHGTVSRLERDQITPTLWLFSEIAKALDTCLCFLYAGGAGCEHDREATA